MLQKQAAVEERRSVLTEAQAIGLDESTVVDAAREMVPTQNTTGALVCKGYKSPLQWCWYSLMITPQKAVNVTNVMFL